ncbi:MAG: FtsX-like permease family protein, partial [Gemmatimonadales bacterium]|nr:FtsX-like permease family protein [Gemmatimonadales bacterium]
MPSRSEPLWRRYLRFFGPDVNADVDDELQFHLEMRERDYRARGLSPDAARAAASKRFGDLPTHRKALRRQDGRRLRRDRWRQRLDEWTADARYALRMLWHHRGFSAAIIATLALGIGATTAIFSAVDAALLRPLPFMAPDRLVIARGVGIAFSVDGKEIEASSGPMLQELRGRKDAFAGAAAYASGGLNLSGIGPPVRIRAGVVTPGFFELLGWRVVEGRPFLPDEGQPGKASVAVLSHRLWQSQFGGEPVVGKRVRLNDVTYEVVGVMPPGASFPELSDLWIPMTDPLTPESFEPFRGYVAHSVIARLAPGVTFDGAAARMRARWSQLPADLQEQYRTEAATPLVALQASLVGDKGKPMLVLLGATGLLLLIGCANVTNLLLAHAAVREREMVIRALLGATRGRLIRQLMVQSLLLALAATGAGLVVAYGGLRLVAALMPGSLNGVSAPAMDLRLLGFSGALALFTALVFGLWPARRAASANA